MAEDGERKLLQPARLVVIDGGPEGRAFPLDQDEIILGRDPAATVQIDNTVISRRHARLKREDDAYLLEDLGSSNGTFINDGAVKTPQRLADGDRIRLGHAVTLKYEAAQYESPVLATMLEANLTQMEEVRETVARALHPSLSVSVGGAPEQTHLLNGESMMIGRAEENDIRVRAQVISRHHARLERSGQGYDLVVLPGVANPIQLRGQPVSERTPLSDGDKFYIESSDPGLQVTFTYQQPGGTKATLLAGKTPAPFHPPVSAPHGAPIGAPAGTIASKPVTPPYGSPPGTPPRPGETVLDAGPVGLPPQLNARLIVTLAGSTPQVHALHKARTAIGRAEDNDIVIASQIVSRHHAVLEQTPDGTYLSVLPEVVNTLVCQGNPVSGRQRLRHGDVLRIDSQIPGMMVTMIYDAPASAAADAAASSQVTTVQFGEKARLTFGRDPANDVLLDVPSVSRFHAQVEKVGRRYRLTDLRSANGTFVNDERISGETWLGAQDTVRMGPYRFVMGEDALTQISETHGLRVEALGLNKWVRKNLNILENISLVFQPREFVVVVGQSGGGKSTLVDSIAGYRPATHGRVMVNGIDVYKNFDAIRNEIGFVPQRDIIHMELTVYQALDYAARLRMPRDTSKSERHKRIMEVLADLDLVHRKDVQISGLSGGQQKRVSIGVELLTKPGLFFLDEPTSGLDPGTETTFMHLMRRLADQGRTIILVTHATKNVMLADKVVFLARGGHLAWFGPPDEALQFFDQYRSEQERRSKPMEFDQIYAILDDASRGNAADWAQRFKEHPAYQKYIVLPLQERQNLALQPPAAAPGMAPATAQAVKAAKRTSRASGLHQLMVLSGRNVRILTRDRSSLILMLAAAPLVGMLDLVIGPLMGRAPFAYQDGDAANGAISLFLMTVYCLLVAGLSQMREIVKEADIYKRERLVNLKILPYVTSKVWVALLLAFYHAAAYAILHYLAFDMPGGTLEIGLFYVTLLLAVMAGMLCGLFASAISPAASSAPLMMILLIVPQIVLSGALAPVPGTVSAIASTRWALEGFIGIVGIGSDVAADRCWSLPEDLRDAMTLDDKAANGCTCMGVAVFKGCNFPGVGQYYEVEVDQPEPAEPPELGERPPEPVIPPAPDPPENNFDSVKVAEYLNALQSYQDEVARIQEDYKNQMQIYEAQANVYKAEMIDYQKSLTEWNIARNSAVKAAEGLIESVTKEFGWAWVNKKDTPAFWDRMFKTWMAQGVIIFVFFVMILGLMKRKDNL